MLVCRQWRYKIQFQATIWQRDSFYLRGVEDETKNREVISFLSTKAMSYVQEQVLNINLAETKCILMPLSNAIYPCLQILNLSETTISGVGISHLPLACPNLRVLIFNNCRNVKEDSLLTMLTICEQKNSLLSLEVLGLSNCFISHKLINRCLERKALPILQRVRVSEVKLSYDNICNIAQKNSTAILSRSPPILSGQVHCIDEHNCEFTDFLTSPTLFANLSDYMRYLLYHMNLHNNY